MRLKQFNQLQQELDRLYGPVLNNNRYVIEGCHVALIQNEEKNNSWVDIQVEVLPVTEKNAFESVCAALAFNGNALSATSNPAWFGMVGEETPCITLTQRVYDATFNIVDLGNFIKKINAQSKALSKQIGLMEKNQNK